MPALYRCLPYAVFLVIILVFGGIFYGGYLTRLPFGIHEWAQGDRLALAISFYDNGMNFLLPATLNQTSINGVVGVEFPLQSYCAAALAHIFGRSSISACFRVFDILIAFSGLLALFHIGYKRSRDFIFSAVAPLFLFCVPVYVYYSGNYLPDPAAVSLCCIGLSFFLDYTEDISRFRKLVFALILFTLATLVKTSAITYLAGVMLYAFIRKLRTDGDIRKALPIMLISSISIAAILANYLHVRYLNKHYDSWMFLLEPRPFKDWNEFVSFLENDYKVYWLTEYLTLPQYPVYVMIVSIGLYFYLCKSSRAGHGWLMLFCLIAGCALAYCFGSQLHIHDYYILAIFYPLIMYGFTVAMLNIREKLTTADRDIRRAVRTALSLVSLLLLFFTDFQMYRRVHDAGPYAGFERASPWLAGGDIMLAKLHVPDTARIVALNEAAPNLPLVYFDRKGYNLPQDNFQKNMGLARDFMNSRHLLYAICKEQTIREILSKDSFALRDFELLHLGADKAILRLKQ